MKALVLAGGAGTRLRPITHTSAKQLVPVANKPILFYGIEALVDAGITDIGVIVGDTRDEIMAAVGDGSRWGVRVEYIHQEAPLGLAHAVLIARGFLGDEPFVMYLGDNMLEARLRDFVEHFAADPEAAAQLLLARVPDPQRFGVAEVDDAGNAVRLVEKPDVPASDLALVGVYLFTAAVHEAVASIRPSHRGELEITDAVQWLIDRGLRVRTKVLDGWWIDTGKLTPLLEANRLILETLEANVAGEVDESSDIEGRVVIAPGAVVKNSTVRGPSIIGARTRIVNSWVGPFSAVGDDCEVIDSEIEHSVVLEGSRIV
ncbi:MAG TPA: glucose-1-phosphate thymidylyltransferase, partial [Acidimicrobiales bacterium]|nr:glucose-1-phosphate thymidylyltransferase [Acidimicrobiales bacterium]